MNEDEIKFKMWVPSPMDVVNVLTVSCHIGGTDVDQLYCLRTGNAELDRIGKEEHRYRDPSWLCVCL